MGQQVASQPDLALEANDFTLIFPAVPRRDLIYCAGPEGRVWRGEGRGDDGGS